MIWLNSLSPFSTPGLATYAVYYHATLKYMRRTKTAKIIIFSWGGGCEVKYCDERLFIISHISKTTRLNFTKYVHDVCLWLWLGPLSVFAISCVFPTFIKRIFPQRKKSVLNVRNPHRSLKAADQMRLKSAHLVRSPILSSLRVVIIDRSFVG